MAFGLPDDLWSAFMRGVAGGTYSLLLGAGASLGGRDAWDGPLPLATDLANQLIEEFDLPAAPGTLSLSRAYAAAARRSSGRRGETVDRYFYERFAGCTPPNWMSLLSTNYWNRIFTLNIDDAVEREYVDRGDQRAQRLRPTHWSLPFFDVRPPGDLSLVYLHGRARSLLDDDSSGVVFSLAQYFDATTAKHSWHKIFGDTFQKQPFLVVGATISQESDLADILERGNSSVRTTGLPSLVVLKEIDAILRDELESYGLVPVEATADELSEAIQAELPRYADAMPFAPGRAGTTQDEVRFVSQFARLEVVEEPERERRHDLYAGQDPTWQDIVRERDARLSVSFGATKAAREALDGSADARLVCIHGGPFTGKSTALLRTARELIASGAGVYRFSGEERIAVGAVLSWVERAGPTVLIADGLADFAADFEELFEAMAGRSAHLPLVIVGAERTARLKPISDRLDPKLLAIGSETRAANLTNEDIRALLDKLKSAGRLGKIAQLPWHTQQAYFRNEHERQLFAAMEGLEHASSFGARLRETWDAVSDPQAREAYAVLSIIHTIGYTTPLDLLSSAAALPVQSLLRAADNDQAFADLVSIRGSHAATKQRTLAGLFVNGVLEAGQRYDLTSRIAVALSPYVSRETISQRTVPARIAGRLMDEEILSDWIGPSNLERWYQEQQKYHGWNARFWEQRALASSRVNAWERAESYAEQAAAIHADAFTLNTLAVVLLRKSVSETPPASDLRWMYHDRAQTALVESQQKGRDKFMHPYVTFFEYTLRLAESDVASGFLPSDKVRRQWRDWEIKASMSQLFRAGVLSDQLDSYRQRWLLLVT